MANGYRCRTYAATHHGRGTYPRDADCRSRPRGPRRSRYSPISGRGASFDRPAVAATGAEFCFGMNSGARRAPTVQPEGACRSPHLCRRASARRWWFRGGSEHLADWPPGFRCGRKGAASAPACRGRRDTPRFRPTGKRFEGWTWRLLGHESGSAGMLAGRHESGDRQAPLRPHRPHHRHTRVHAKAQLRAERQPRPETRQRGESRDWREAGLHLAGPPGPALRVASDSGLSPFTAVPARLALRAGEQVSAPRR
jgi:hypothetical protein